MSDPGLSRPDACSIRAAAGHAEFAEAARGVPDVGGCLLTDNYLPLPGRDRRVRYHSLRPVLNAALASVPYPGSGYPIGQLGAAGAQLVGGNRGQGTGAGR